MPALLEALDEGEKSGTRLLKMGKGGGAADLRFKVVAQKPGTTQVGLRASHCRVKVEILPEVTLPPAANIDIR